MKIDSRTGLPEVPEGQYWKVEKNSPYRYFADKYMLVSLHHADGTQISCTRAGTRWADVPYDDVRPRHIRRAAKEILIARASKMKSQQLEGIYPPKSLLK